MNESPRIREDGDRYIVRLERTCPHCNKEVVKHYDRETLKVVVGHMPIIECPHCKERF